MELKYMSEAQSDDNTLLLIEPYGIEIGQRMRKQEQQQTLLIEPYGIEIVKNNH